MAAKIRKGDKVIVLSGRDKGRTGEVFEVRPSDNKALGRGVNLVKRHQKPRGQGMPGGIIDKEAAIPACKVMLLCPACKKATRVGHKFLEDGKKKARVCKKCGAAFDS